MQDLENMFSIEQAITGDAQSTDIVDLLGAPAAGSGKTGGFTTDYKGNVVDNDPGKSPALDLEIKVVADFNLLTSLTVNLLNAAAHSSGTLTTPTTIATSGAIPLASLKAGYTFRIALPPSVSLRYLGIGFDVVGTDPTLGKITAGLVQRNGKPTAPGTFK